MNIEHLRELIVLPVLKQLDMHTENAVDLVIGTGLVESRFHHLKQISGPALGFYQCEPATYMDIKRYLGTRPDILAKLLEMLNHNDLPDVSQLAGNLYLSTAICRIHYWMKPDPIPDTVEGQAAYWKRHYYTSFGRGTADKYLKALSHV